MTQITAYVPGKRVKVTRSGMYIGMYGIIKSYERKENTIIYRVELEIGKVINLEHKYLAPNG